MLSVHSRVLFSLPIVEKIFIELYSRYFASVKPFVPNINPNSYCWAMKYLKNTLGLYMDFQLKVSCKI